MLPPVGHSSNHECHCRNLQDNRAVVRIFIALLRLINSSRFSKTPVTSVTVFVPRKLPENAHNCDVFCPMFLNMFEDYRFRFQYTDLLMTEVQVALRMPYLRLRSSIVFLFYTQYSQHNGTPVMMSRFSTSTEFKASYCIVTCRGEEC